MDQSEVSVMRQEARLAAVRSLSQGALALLAPEQGGGFERDFGCWVATAAGVTAREGVGPEDLVYAPPDRAPKGRERPTPGGAPKGLDTTLVAGMFFQVILEAEHLPGNTLERTSYVKQAVKNFLVQRLAGQISLSQFFRLVQLIEHEVGYYFHRLQGDWLSPGEPSPPEAAPGRGTGYRVAQAPTLKDYELRLAINRLPLPRQPNRKLSPEALYDFLVKSEGRWFRLLDFEADFKLNKKTAWNYLTLLLHHDILRHNEEKANKVRYALSLRFLAPEGLGQP